MDYPISSPASMAVADRAWTVSLGELQLGEELSRGANGVVRSARVFGTPVAAKSLHGLLSPELYESPPGSEGHRRT